MDPLPESELYAVEAHGLTKRFGTFMAVNDVSLKVRKGEVFGFLGPNGAGKSTTIRMLCGLLAPTSGTATVGAFDVGANPDAVKATIGYMSQRFSLYEDLTVEQNINFFGGIYGLEGDRLESRKAWAVEMAGLKGKESLATHSLSGGWKQRLALGCAVLHEPPIIFLDEPTGGVDPISRRNFWDLIYHLSSRGTTVFVTTHYMDEAEHCNTIGFIYAGKLVAMGGPSDLKHRLDAFTILEVACDRPVEAMEILQKERWVRETSIFGSLFHVSVENDGDAENAIRSVLPRHGISVSSISPIVPSLEDVFINLIAQEDARNGAEA